jgi:hypothetical protein
MEHLVKGCELNIGEQSHLSPESSGVENTA